MNSIRSLADTWLTRIAFALCMVPALTPAAMQKSKEASRPRTDVVELDAVVVDGHDQPMRGLRKEDFQVKDDGHPVDVTSFTEVSAAGIDGPADARTLVMLLDDTGVGPMATTVVQNIARLFLSRARPVDRVAASA